MNYRFILIMFMEIISGAVTHNGCEQDHAKRKVSCSGLEEPVDEILPDSVPPSTRELYMNKVWVDDSVTLNPRNLLNLKELVIVDFSYNRIVMINDDTFKDMVYLESVNLSYNRLKLLESNAFSGILPKLWSIDLSNNRLLVLIDYNLKSAMNLHYLDLRNNPILFISPGSFSGLSYLRTLKLSSSNFTKFPAEPLSSLRNLENLEVCNMPFIKSIPSHSFSFNGRLKHLVLEKITLSAGGLTVNAFAGIKELITLSIASCNLTAIPRAVLSGVPNLEKLDLSRNSIQSIFPGDFAHLTSLKKIILHHTDLHEIKTESFARLKNLEVLDLTNNRLKTLYREVFPSNLTKLKQILITHNTWSCDCGLKWIAKVSHIDLGRDPVTCTNPSTVRGRSFLRMRTKLPVTFYNCSAPTLQEKQYSNVIYVEGERATLPCRAKGETLSFTWYHANTILPVRETTALTNGNARDLVIHNVAKDDAGEYTCVIRNAGGQVHLTVTLIVDFAPHGDIAGKTSLANRHNCPTCEQFLDMESSKGPPSNFLDTDVDRRSSTTTVILVAILGCITTLGIVGVFVFVGWIWNKRRDAHLRGVKKIQFLETRMNGNGHCRSRSEMKLNKTGTKANGVGERVVLGGHGLYSKPVEQLSYQTSRE